MKFLILGLFIFLPNCGVHVGNGTTKDFKSPYGYSFAYDEKLTVRESADKKTVMISNEGLVQGNEPVSHLTFEVDTSRRVGAKSDLAAIAQQDHYVGYVEPKQINLGGFEGYFKSRGLDNGLREIYFLSTKNQELLQIKLMAFNLAKGVETLSQLIRSVKKEN